MYIALRDGGILLEDTVRQNEQGFTLVEIIAAITLFGIVVFSLLPIFPQIIKWAGIADKELTGNNLSTKVVDDILHYEADAGTSQPIAQYIIDEELLTTKCTSSASSYIKLPNAVSEQLPEYKIDDKTYDVELAGCIYDGSDIDTILPDTYRLQIKVLEPDGKKLAETYMLINKTVDTDEEVYENE